MALQPLRCPQCMAPLTRDANGNDPQECPYCHAALSLQKPAVIIGAPPPGGGSNALPIVAIVALVALGLIGAVVFLFLAPAQQSSTVVVSAPVQAMPARPAEPLPPPAPAPVPKPPSPVTEVLRFGQPGTNPGQLSNANHLAVASDGTYFVGETSTGRLQKFDAEGKYVDGLTLPGDKLTKQNGIFGMTADAKGHVYVIRVGDVLVYEAATLKLVRTLAGDYPDRYYHHGLAVDASGHVHVLAERMGDVSLFTLTPEGKPTGHFRVSAHDVAVDGTGRLFLVGDDGLEVRDAKGAVVSKVGVKGRSVAFDGNGHVFVGSGSSVEVLGVDGTKLVTLPVSSNDLALDAKGRLVAVESGSVSVHEVKLP